AKGGALSPGRHPRVDTDTRCAGLATRSPPMGPSLSRIPQDRLRRDIAPGHAGAEGCAGADCAGADRVGHGVAAGEQARDDAAVGAERLGLVVGADAAFRGDGHAIDFHRVKGRLLDLAQCYARPAELVALPYAFAALKILVAIHLAEAVEALDRRREGRRGNADAPSNLL